MCLICVHLEKDKMTVEEGYSALAEMRADIEEKHLEEVETLLFQKFAESWCESEYSEEETGYLEELEEDWSGSEESENLDELDLAWALSTTD